ncbi:reverse transcriptase domain-containing protein [Tanacetum coccineum]|uniref:Reverse transcriptase domain-containing protein n=1 Tax=Tanacetum coccineum TaxID=301880 RepID=A0ABQ5EBF3_9ASTR
MAILTLKRPGPSIEIDLVTEIDPAAQKDEGKVNPYHPADQKVAPVIKDTGSQEQKGANCSRKTRMLNNVKTYDGTGDPEDHLKIFQAAEQVERWAMPTWCHMFNSTLIGVARVWFDELPPESIDGYKGLKVAFLAYFMQQKKYVKDLVEIQNIKQRDGTDIKEMDIIKAKTDKAKH